MDWRERRIMIRWDWWYTATNEQIRQDKEGREGNNDNDDAEGKKGRKERQIVPAGFYVRVGGWESWDCPTIG